MNAPVPAEPATLAGHLLRIMDEAVVCADADGRVVLANEAAGRLFGRDPAGMVGRDLSELIPPEYRQSHGRWMREFARDGGRSRLMAARSQVKAARADGTVVPVEASIAHAAVDGRPMFLAVLREASGQTEAIRRLRESERRLAEAARLASLGFWEWDVATGVLYWSEEIFRIFGRDPGNGAPGYEEFLESVHPEDRPLVERAVAAAMEGEPYLVEHRLVRPGGEVRHVREHGVVTFAAGRPARMFGTVQDLTDRLRAEQEIRRLALLDDLTGLPNRNTFREALARHAATASADARLGLLCVDLDQFKLVNDNLGHGTGDLLLVAAAQRIRACVRGADLACRLGGDEFTVLLPGLDGPDTAADIAERVLQSLRKPFQVNGRELFVTGSVGITLAPDHGTDPEQLQANADSAMYAAKEAGRDCARLFTPALAAAVSGRATLAEQLRLALRDGGLSLHYQPILAVDGGAVVGCEALLRWRHPRVGDIPPASFIPVAEETGLIGEVGAWALRTACAEVGAMAGGAPMLAVNVSPREFRSPGYVDRVARILAEVGFPASRLCLELTEGVVLRDIDAARESLRSLRALGIRIALDDFGTGYSSLSYLARLPVDSLKIDRSFMREVTGEDCDAPLARSIIGIGLALGLGVTAEGVEDGSQLAFLRRHGCHQAQGYHLSRPMPAPDFAAFLARHGRAAA